MQNAKDTFYEVLRDRIAAIDADRTVVLRGSLRPAVLVEENEIVDAQELRDCFRLQWTAVRVEAEGLVELGCEITYATAGSPGGLDRGRRLAGLDAELEAAVNGSPQNAARKSFAALASGGMPALVGSRIWWTNVLFGAAVTDGSELRRTAKVTVWSYEEAGEA